jgi:uncharacterized membrane protein HdeD (DUF308 family)
MASKIATAVEARGFPWWLVLVEGSIALIFGLLLITAPSATSVFLMTALGFYFLIRGIFSIIEIFIPNRGIHWVLLLCMGILGIIAGLVVLRNLVTVTAVAGIFIVVFVACVALIMGFVGIVRGAFLGGGWGSGILGIVSIIIAICLFANLLGAFLALPIVLGACMIVGGIVAMVYSFRIRKA